MERLARMPEVGDEIQEDEHRLKVLDLKDRRVGRVVIKRCTPVEATSGSNKAKSSEAGTSADTLEGTE